MRDVSAPLTGMPPLDWERGACPDCGATTVVGAGLSCKSRGGDECPGSEREDAEGYLLQPTAASIARVDVWCDEQMAAEEAAEQSK